MNDKELREFLNKIAASYPNFIKRDTNKTEIVKAWDASLRDISVDAANAALEKHIRQSAFIPTPADIRKLVDVHDKWGSMAAAIENNKRTYFRVTGKEWTA